MSAASPITKACSKLGALLDMIKFEHTIFALPFALTSAMLAAHGMPAYRLLVWILGAMVGARSSAMAFNRIADLYYDSLNPRTRSRALPAGIIRTGEAWLLTAAAAAVFVFAAWELNPLAFYLSPVALICILGYSYTKRFTSMSHMVLGLSLGIAPVGAWIGITGRFELTPVILSAVVIFWTAGFDIIYSLQDLDFDAEFGLFSIPRRLGATRGLLVSRIFHGLSIVLLIAFGVAEGLGTVYYVGIVFVAMLLIYEQSLVKPDDLSKVNTAFFNVNGFVSIGFFLMTLADLLVRKAMH